MLETNVHGLLTHGHNSQPVASLKITAEEHFCYKIHCSMREDAHLVLLKNKLFFLLLLLLVVVVVWGVEL